MIAADALLAALFAVATAIAVTGGGVLAVGSHSVGLRSPDNALIALAALLLLRYPLLERHPLFGRTAWTRSALDRRAALLLADNGRSQSRCGSARFVLAVCALAAVTKAALAAANPGFFSGDDVEVQEMSLAALRYAAWPIWDLRNATFPFAFVYPSQWIALHAGAHDVAWLVWAGRAAVALVSSLSIWLLWRAAERLFDGAHRWSVVAAVLFALSRLQMAFGSSELPRPVSTVFVLAAFVLLQSASGGRALAAGIATGLGASLRFSEAVFLVPALVQLAGTRRWRDAIVLAAAAVATGAGVLAVTDQLYWGSAFHSARAIVDYTLVRGLSSRGYEGPAWYLLRAAQWVSPPIFVLALLGTARRRLDAALWAWLPIGALSCLPHHEARYMIPAAPFVYLLAVDGMRMLSERSTRAWVPLAVVSGVMLGVLFDVGHWRLPRSNADVALARAVAADVPPGAGLAAEQRWRLGGHLYLGERASVDLAPLEDRDSALQQANGATWLVLDSRSHAYGAAAEALASRGYRVRDYAAASTYRVWVPK